MTEMKTGIKNRVTFYSSFHVGYMASSLQPVLTANFNVIQADLALVMELNTAFKMTDMVTLLLGLFNNNTK
jgi:hypothetical protein